MQLKNLPERLLREAVLHETLSGYEIAVSVIGQKIEEGCCSLPRAFLVWDLRTTV
jgi:hypothetical protein